VQAQQEQQQQQQRRRRRRRRLFKLMINNRLEFGLKTHNTNYRQLVVGLQRRQQQHLRETPL
jgi:ribosomal protein L20